MRDCLSRFGGTMYGTPPRGFPFDNFIIACWEVVYNAKFKNEIEKSKWVLQNSSNDVIAINFGILFFSYSSREYRQKQILSFGFCKFQNHFRIC